jgi:hypothetical protein
MDLAALAPAGELASSGFALARPGHHYVVLRRAGAGELRLRVEPGTYDLRWYDVAPVTSTQ